ncbi:hypothetical protein TRFO_41219 [Tritrichomonas foetus]|uniref:Uncharacterized protein n=1 Tax=Tritrichomonas foetus TaxID=1144522 RepID=A0A1J4L5I1_9EUKA|nr:hypothetical protein TRFO_41219 [Tritrichomonas foetus]|eukprot:OHT17189.1 hypothetical protein TRFO_41219 [Tritrichomonas foetus]
MIEIVSNKKDLEKLEQLILQKALEVDGLKDEYMDKIYHRKYPPMNQRLCPWKETTERIYHKQIIKKKKKSTTLQNAKRRKNNLKEKRITHYNKNLQYAQEYNIYPVKMTNNPTPAQFIFMGDEDFEFLQNDIFRDRVNDFFPITYNRRMLNIYFNKWKKKTNFDVVQIMRNINIKILKDRPKSHSKSHSHHVIDQKSFPHHENHQELKVIPKRKPLNDDYDVSPISTEYRTKKRIKTPKSNERLFRSSLKINQVGDLENDIEWQKIRGVYGY